MASLPWKPGPISRSWWAIKALFAHFPAKLAALFVSGLFLGGSVGMVAATQGAGLAWALYTAAMMLALPWAYGVLSVSFLDAARGRRFSNREVLAHAARSAPAIGLVGVLGGLFVGATFAAMTFLMLLSAKYGWLGVLGLVLDMLLMALVMLRIMDTDLIIIGEGVGPLQAIRLSFTRFSMGRALRMLGNGIVGGFVFVFLPLVLGVVLLAGTAMGAGAQGAAGLAAFLTVLGSAGLLLLPVFLFSSIANTAISLGIPAAFYAEARGEELKRLAGSPAPSLPVVAGYGALVALAALTVALTSPSLPTTGIRISQQAPASMPATPPAMRHAAPPVSDAAVHRNRAWAAWQAGDAARALAEAEAALHAGRDSWADAATGTARMQRRREARAWATAMRAWSLHRLGREQEAVQALVQACALGHRPSCAVGRSLP